MRDPRERLRDVLEAIEHIERYAARGRDVRHILHGCFEIDAGAVWEAVERDIPDLKRHIKALPC